MILYHYKTEEDIKQLCAAVRRDPLSKEEVLVDLGEDLFIRCIRARALVNAYIFQVFDHYELPSSIRKEFVFQESYRKGRPNKYMNHIARILRDDSVVFFRKEIFLSWILADIKSCFYAMALEVNGVVTIDHSLIDYVKAYEEHEVFRDMILRPGFDKTSNPYVVEEIVGTMRNRFKEEIKIKPIFDFFRSGTKINQKQVQMFFCYGIPPDFANMYAALPPINEGLLGGFRDVYSQFILDCISRLSNVAGKSDVKEVGVVFKRLSVVLDSVKLNAADTRHTIHDCGNHDLFPITITTEDDLQFYRGKELYDPATKKSNGYIDIHRKELVGKVAYIRSFMTCRGSVICEKCFGYNYDYVRDTELYKMNLSAHELQEIAAILQGVISIKHFTIAALERIFVEFQGVSTEFMNFMETSDVFTKLSFDKLHINPKYHWEVVQIKTGERTISRRKRDSKGRLMKDDRGIPMKEKHKIDVFSYGIEIEGVPLKLSTQVFNEYNKEEGWVKILIPNDSVLIRGKDLKQAVNSHSNAKTGDFDTRTCYSGKLSLIEQVQMVYEYIRKKIDMSHFIYYEALVRALVRDDDDLSSGISDTTKQIRYIHANSALTKPGIGRTVSTKLQHGYIHANMNTLNTETEATEIDILHQNTGKPRSVHQFKSNEIYLEMMMKTFRSPVDVESEIYDENI